MFAMVRNNGPPARLRLPPPRRAAIRASELKWWQRQWRLEQEWKDLEATKTQWNWSEALLADLADRVFSLLTSETEIELTTEETGGSHGTDKNDYEQRES